MSLATRRETEHELRVFLDVPHRSHVLTGERHRKCLDTAIFYFLFYVFRNGYAKLSYPTTARSHRVSHEQSLITLSPLLSLYPPSQCQNLSSPPSFSPSSPAPMHNPSPLLPTSLSAPVAQTNLRLSGKVSLALNRSVHLVVFVHPSPRLHTCRLPALPRNHQNRLHRRQGGEQPRTGQWPSCLGVRYPSHVHYPSSVTSPRLLAYDVDSNRARTMDIITNSFCAVRILVSIR